MNIASNTPADEPRPARHKRPARAAARARRTPAARPRRPRIPAGRRHALARRQRIGAASARRRVRRPPDADFGAVRDRWVPRRRGARGALTARRPVRAARKRRAQDRGPAEHAALLGPVHGQERVRQPLHAAGVRKHRARRGVRALPRRRALPGRRQRAVRLCARVPARRGRRVSRGRLHPLGQRRGVQSCRVPYVTAVCGALECGVRGWMDHGNVWTG